MPQTLHQPHPAAANRTIGPLLKFCSWSLGIIAIAGGAAGVSKNPLYRILLVTLGVFLLPFSRKHIGRWTGIRLAQRAALPLAVAILTVMALQTREIQAEKKIELQRSMALAREQERSDSVLLVQYPFVNRDSLRSWRTATPRGETAPPQALDSFLRRQQDLHRQFVIDSLAFAKKVREDSIALAKKVRADSIALVRQRLRDSLAQVREAARTAAQQRRLAWEAERANAPETYNGHVIFTGPRGGRYYINSNGNKTYIH